MQHQEHDHDESAARLANEMYWASAQQVIQETVIHAYTQYAYKNAGSMLWRSAAVQAGGAAHFTEELRPISGPSRGDPSCRKGARQGGGEAKRGWRGAGMGWVEQAERQEAEGQEARQVWDGAPWQAR